MRGVSVIVGGQFGSCGKGKVSQFWTDRMEAKAVVRVGGPNSGHTDLSGKRATRMLPAGVMSNPKEIKAVFPAGSYLNLEVLKQEILDVYGSIEDANILVNPNAWIIGTPDEQAEELTKMKESIGSTCSGTGTGVIMRAKRKYTRPLAKNVDWLQPFLCDTTDYLVELCRVGYRVIVEGTQGFGLSLLHTSHYPYATARDTTAAGFLSEAGLSPLNVEHVVMVLRSYPIRVGGNSGPMVNELSWEDIEERSGSQSAIREYTTVTKRLRRVSEFDADLVRRAIRANQPDVVVMNHVDYIDKTNKDLHVLSDKQWKYLERIQHEIMHGIDYVGTAESIIFPI